MGLLDLINSDAGMVLAAGLLDAGAAKPVRTGTMQGIAQSLLGAQQYKQAQEDRAFRQKQLQAQLEEQQAQAQARREQAQMLQNRQKLLGAMDPNAGPPAQVSIPQALANGISLQEMAAMTPQARQPEYKVVGGALVRIDGDGVKEAYRQPDKPELNQLIVQGPDGKPMINDLLLRAKSQIAKSGASSVSVNTGDRIPPALVKQQDEIIDRITTAMSTDADLAGVEAQLSSGKLKFGPLTNLINEGRNISGLSTEESRAFGSFKSTLEKLRNDSLRLNAGVQTDGDAQRAWNELFQNINDTKFVAQRLGEIRKINRRAAELHGYRLDVLRRNSGAGPLSIPTPKPAIGDGDGQWSITPVGK